MAVSAGAGFGYPEAPAAGRVSLSEQTANMQYQLGQLWQLP